MLWVNGPSYSAELFTSQWRFLSYIISAVPTYDFVFALVLYLNRTFTGIHLCCGILSMVILPFYFILPESPRWLAQNDREDESLQVLIKWAKINGRFVTYSPQ